MIPKETNNILYHYTSVETLYKIFHNQENGYIKLRANFFMNMNDPLDCRYLINEISRLANKGNDSYAKINYDNAIKNAGIPYFISFSSKGDDLPMWKMYGDNGHGVVIGFDRNEIEKSTQNYQKRGAQDDILIAKQCFCKLYDCKYWNINDIKTEYWDKYFRREKESLLTIQDIAVISYLVKSPYYHYEDETRVVFLYTPSNKPAPDFINFHVPINSIKIIKAGPCIDVDYIKTFIPDCLKENVLKSNIPYTDMPRYVSPDSFLIIG